MDQTDDVWTGDLSGRARCPRHGGPAGGWPYWICGIRDGHSRPRRGETLHGTSLKVALQCWMAGVICQSCITVYQDAERQRQAITRYREGEAIPHGHQ